MNGLPGANAGPEPWKLWRGRLRAAWWCLRGRPVLFGWNIVDAGIGTPEGAVIDPGRPAVIIGNQVTWEAS